MTELLYYHEVETADVDMTRKIANHLDYHIGLKLENYFSKKEHTAVESFTISTLTYPNTAYTQFETVVSLVPKVGLIPDVELRDIKKVLEFDHIDYVGEIYLRRIKELS